LLWCPAECPPRGVIRKREKKLGHAKKVGLGVRNLKKGLGSGRGKGTEWRGKFHCLLKRGKNG